MRGLLKRIRVQRVNSVDVVVARFDNNSEHIADGRVERQVDLELASVHVPLVVAGHLRSIDHSQLICLITASDRRLNEVRGSVEDDLSVRLARLRDVVALVALTVQELGSAAIVLRRGDAHDARSSVLSVTLCSALDLVVVTALLVAIGLQKAHSERGRVQCIVSGVTRSNLELTLAHVVTHTVGDDRAQGVARSAASRLDQVLGVRVCHCRHLCQIRSSHDGR